MAIATPTRPSATPPANPWFWPTAALLLLPEEPVELGLTAELREEATDESAADADEVALPAAAEIDDDTDDALADAADASEEELEEVADDNDEARPVLVLQVC